MSPAGTTLVARLDNVGDVLLAGPAVRAVAAVAGPVTFLAGPRGAEAATMLPGVANVWTFDAPWVGFDRPRPAPDEWEECAAGLVERVRGAGIVEAIVLTSFHQSPLPLAMLLRMAGVERISATCVDYPGALLDLRHPYRPELHEVEQSLDLCRAAGFDLAEGDDARLRVVTPSWTDGAAPAGPYVVLHPGASVPARAIADELAADVVRELVGSGHHVVVTGSIRERELARRVAGGVRRGDVTVLAGDLDLVALACVLEGAEVVICGNTGPAHLAAAVGTPVVQVFAPTVPAHRWRPWGVPSLQLGHAGISCAGCRARTCPFAGQPCIAGIGAAAVVAAVQQLRTGRLAA